MSFHINNTYTALATQFLPEVAFDEVSQETVEKVAFDLEFLDRECGESGCHSERTDLGLDKVFKLYSQFGNRRISLKNCLRKTHSCKRQLSKECISYATFALG